MNTLLFFLALITGLVLLFSDSGCFSRIIGIILLIFALTTLTNTFNEADKEFVQTVPEGQYQMMVQESIEAENRTVKKLAAWLIENETTTFRLVKHSNSYGCIIFEGTAKEEVYTINNKELRILVEEGYINLIS